MLGLNLNIVSKMGPGDHQTKIRYEHITHLGMVTQIVLGELCQDWFT